MNEQNKIGDGLKATVLIDGKKVFVRIDSNGGKFSIVPVSSFTEALREIAATARWFKQEIPFTVTLGARLRGCLV